MYLTGFSHENQAAKFLKPKTHLLFVLFHALLEEVFVHPKHIEIAEIMALVLSQPAKDLQPAVCNRRSFAGRWEIGNEIRLDRSQSSRQFSTGAGK